MTAPPPPYELQVNALLAEFGDRWETPEAIGRVREGLIAKLPGWRIPAAYGIGTADASGFTFAKTNIGEHPLPAAVMSTVLGHKGGTASYRLDRWVLAQAIRLLEPAEVCTEYQHPNLWAWRPLIQELSDGAVVYAVFLGDLADESEDPGVAELRAIAAQA